MAGNLVFIYGYYGCGNLGDELLLSAAAGGILDRWPSARFVVRNMGPVAPEARLKDRILTTDIERRLHVPGRSRVLRAASYLHAARLALRGCCCLVLGGGTLVHAKKSLASLTLLTTLVLMARLRGLPVIGLGLGAAHLKGWGGRLLSRVLVALMDDIAVRDEASLEALRAPAKVRLTADLVYGWWPRAPVRETTTTRDRIAVTLWSLPPLRAPRLVEALAAALVARARQGDHIRFLVFQHGDAASGGLSDVPAIDSVRTRLEANGVASEVVYPAADLRALRQAFNGVVVHVGARFHASVVASLLGIPSVGISTDPKIANLCKTFAMPALTPEEVSLESLLDAIAAARKTPVPFATLEALRRRADANFTWFDARATSLQDATRTPSTAGAEGS